MGKKKRKTNMDDLNEVPENELDDISGGSMPPVKPPGARGFSPGVKKKNTRPAATAAPKPLTVKELMEPLQGKPEVKKMMARRIIRHLRSLPSMPPVNLRINAPVGERARLIGLMMGGSKSGDVLETFTTDQSTGDQDQSQLHAVMGGVIKDLINGVLQKKSVEVLFEAFTSKEKEPTVHEMKTVIAGLDVDDASFLKDVLGIFLDLSQSYAETKPENADKVTLSNQSKYLPNMWSSHFNPSDMLLEAQSPGANVMEITQKMTQLEGQYGKMGEFLLTHFEALFADIPDGYSRESSLALRDVDVPAAAPPPEARAATHTGHDTYARAQLDLLKELDPHTDDEAAAEAPATAAAAAPGTPDASVVRRRPGADDLRVRRRTMATVLHEDEIDGVGAVVQAARRHAEATSEAEKARLEALLADTTNISHGGRGDLGGTDTSPSMKRKGSMLGGLFKGRGAKK